MAVNRDTELYKIQTTGAFGMLSHKWNIYSTPLFQTSEIYLSAEARRFQEGEVMDGPKIIVVPRHNSLTDILHKSSTDTSQTESQHGGGKSAWSSTPSQELFTNDSFGQQEKSVFFNHVALGSSTTF